MACLVRIPLGHTQYNVDCNVSEAEYQAMLQYCGELWRRGRHPDNLTLDTVALSRLQAILDDITQHRVAIQPTVVWMRAYRDVKERNFAGLGAAQASSRLRYPYMCGTGA
jgi:hypothetical protein